MWRKDKEVNTHIIHKLQIGIIKILPMLLAFIYGLNSILSCVDIDLEILSYIGGTSLIPIVFMYITSYMFKFCEYHRMFLHYVVICNLINIYDMYIGIPISTLTLLNVHFILIILLLFITLRLYLNSKKLKYQHSA